MNQNKLNEIIKNQWEILPEDIRDLVFSSELESKINWVAGKYNLSPDQTEILKQETLFVLMGLSHIMEYTDNLMTQLAIPKEQARVIAQEVGTQIFAGVKEIIKELGWVIEERREWVGETAQIKTETQSVLETKVTPQSKMVQTPPATNTNPTIIKRKEDIVPNIPVAGILIEQTEPASQKTAPKEALTNRAILLDEIENPALIPEHSGTIVDQKLSGITKIPREEVKISMQNIPTANTTQPTPPTPPAKRYDGTDPYREPIE